MIRMNSIGITNAISTATPPFCLSLFFIKLQLSFEGEQISVTCSIGVREFRAGIPLSQIIIEADAALYEAKRFGRNRVVISPGERSEKT